MRTHSIVPVGARPMVSTRGFALLITITLLAFLVLLLVSLAALTRVETQVASNNQQAAQARQNALLALQVAVGQLQKFAGPDQRSTTRADLGSFAGAPAPTDTSATFDTFWKTRSRYWTGVWGNKESSIGYDLRPDQIPLRGVTPGLLTWLISGNEKTTFTLNGTKGGVTPGTPDFSPDGAVANLSGATALSTNITIADRTGAPRPAVLLVGPNTVESATVSRNDYVAAPTVDITAPAGAVPGSDPTSTTPVLVGRYAYWVGDEGIKARINLQNGYQRTGVTTDQINSFITSQRTAPQFVNIDNSASPVALGTTFDQSDDGNASNDLVQRLLKVDQLPMVGFTPGAQSDLRTVARARFHELGTVSHSVLADTYAGGLKKDITADIADTSSGGGGRPADGDPIFPTLSSSEINLPTWGHLRSWARLTPNASGGIAPQVPSDTKAGFAPVVTYASLGSDFYVDNANTIRCALFPIIVLFNPYPVPIAGDRYSVGFKLPAGTTCPVWAAAAPSDATISAQLSAASNIVATFDWGQAAFLPGNATSTASNFISFVVNGTNTPIPPGEAHVYLLGTGSATYTGVNELVRAQNITSIGVTNHVVLPSSFTLDASITNDSHIRLGGIGDNSRFIEIALSKEGGLNTRTDHYQSFRMIVAQLANFVSDCRLNTRVLTTTGPTKVGTYWRNDETNGARNAIRLNSSLEHSGQGYSSMDLFGMSNWVETIWLRHGNLRAPQVQATTVENQYPASIKTGSTFNIKEIRGTTIAGVLVTHTSSLDWGHDLALYPKNNGYVVSMAGWMDTSQGGDTPYTTLFDVLKTPDRLLSLGQLQHAPFARHSFYSSYVFGNSLADVRVPRTATYKANVVERPPGVAGANGPAYDLSWHLNRALWDRYFVSGVPATWTQAKVDARTPLPNARMIPVVRNGAAPSVDSLRYAGGANAAYDRAAANLLVEGGFNINSTSEQAWRAVLGGSLGFPKTNAGDYADPADPVDEIVPYPRISWCLSRSASGPHKAIAATMPLITGTKFRNSLYHGNRGLYLKGTDAAKNGSASAVVNELARTLVREIRTRGPFLSLADFVNRPILGAKQPAGIKGALQAAIDTTQAPGQVNPYIASFNSPVKDSDAQLPYVGWDAEHFSGGPVSEVGTGRDSFRFASNYAPKFITQADLLSTLGPALTARSDTFTVRTYGEVINPVTQTVEGRAWCEAVVQRVADYVKPDAAQPPETAALGDNITFGRRFKIVSYRWLSPSDI